MLCKPPHPILRSLLPVEQRTAQVGDLCKNITLLLDISCKHHEIASSKEIHESKEKIVQWVWKAKWPSTSKHCENTKYNETIQTCLYKGQWRLLDLKELDIEGQSRVTWDTRDALAAVCKMCGNCQSSLSTGWHASNTDVPTLDDLAGTKLEGERLAFLIC